MPVKRTVRTKPDKAWRAGWKAGVDGHPVDGNPYYRRLHRSAWKNGWAASQNVEPEKAGLAKLRAARQDKRRPWRIRRISAKKVSADAASSGQSD